MDYSNKTRTALPIGICLFINLPNDIADCSRVESNPNCVYCPVAGKFLSGENIDEEGIGHFSSRVIFSLTFVIGVAAIFMSGFIIHVLKRQRKKSSFDILLLALAIFDLLASFFSMVTSLSMIAFFENWTRGYAPLFGYLVGVYLYLFAKSGSSFLIVVIAAERYTAIAFPFQAANWVTPKKTIAMVIFVCVLSCLLSLPRFAAQYIVKNSIGEGIPSIEGLDYLFYWTEIGPFFYVELKSVHDQIDFWLPLLILVVLTSLTYYEMRKFTLQESHLNDNQKKELHYGQMFIPIVIIFFLSNITSIIVGFNISWYRVAYREVILLGLLACVLNSSVNFPIYYWRSASFRKEASKNMKILCFKKTAREDDPENIEIKTYGRSEESTCAQGEISPIF